MLMPKKNRKAIYEYLFQYGVCVAPQDTNAKEHFGVEKVPNLHVMKAMQVHFVLLHKFNKCPCVHCSRSPRGAT